MGTSLCVTAHVHTHKEHKEAAGQSGALSLLLPETGSVADLGILSRLVKQWASRPACIYCPYSRTVNIHPQWLLYIGSRDPAHVLVLARHMESLLPVELASQPPLFTKRCKIFIVNQLILGGQIRDMIP